MPDIASLFRVSAFEPMRAHMARVMECVGLVRPLLEALKSRDHAKVQYRPGDRQNH